MASSQGAKVVDEESSFKARLSWVLLVVIVPILVTVLIIGGALQVVGVPVWSTVLDYLGFGPKPHASVNPVTVVRKQLSAAQMKNATLSEQMASLQSQLQHDKAVEQQLQAHIQQLESTVSNRHSAQERAKREAAILAGMDAGQAAQVLSKMTLSEGAQVVAQMQNTNASDVLAAMSPDLASRLVNLSAQIVSAQSNASK